MHSFSPPISSSDWYKLSIKWESLHNLAFYWLLRLLIYLLLSPQCSRKHCSLTLPLSSHTYTHTPQGQMIISADIWIPIIHALHFRNEERMWKSVWKIAMSAKDWGEKEGVRWKDKRRTTERKCQIRSGWRRCKEREIRRTEEKKEKRGMRDLYTPTARNQLV